MDKKISVVIPHYPAVPGADAVLKSCTESLRGHAELIVVVNDGTGYAKAVNQGLKIASGDYLVVANNDTMMTRGSLQELASLHAVTTPQVFPTPRDTLPRCFFCMPRWVYLVTEGFDERFIGGYFEDDDFIQRLREREIPMKTKYTVEIYHKDGGGMSMKFIGEEKSFTLNRQVFIDKWGFPPA